MKKPYFKLIVAMLIFGSLGIFVRKIPLASGEIVLARTLLGSIALFFPVILQRKKTERSILWRNLPLLVLSGVVMGLNWMFLFEAYRFTTVSAATLAYYCSPVILMLLSPLLLKETLTRYRIAGILIAMAGMWLVNGGNLEGSAPIRGLCFGLFAAVFYALLTILNKYVKGIHGMEITLVQLISASVILLPYVLISHQGPWILPSGEGLAAVLIVGVVHTGIACYLYFSTIQQLPGQTIALFSYIDPLSALIFSALFLGERLSFLQGLGAVMILGGAAFGELYSNRLKKF